jgi:hypothetical protein
LGRSWFEVNPGKKFIISINKSDRCGGAPLPSQLHRKHKEEDGDPGQSWHTGENLFENYLKQKRMGAWLKW